MARLLFALGSIVCASGVQALAIAIIVSVTIPNYEGGLEAFLPSVLWLGGTIILVLSCPLWIFSIYDRWRDWRPPVIRNLLVVPWIVTLAATGLLVEAIGVAIMMALRS